MQKKDQAGVLRVLGARARWSSRAPRRRLGCWLAAHVTHRFGVLCNCMQNRDRFGSEPVVHKTPVSGTPVCSNIGGRTLNDLQRQILTLELGIIGTLVERTMDAA
jgi:hypothetical protein